jgi:hypothetical protein
MSDRNAYQIRADLLRLAYDILLANSVRSGDSGNHVGHTPFTVLDVIATAKVLNEFVSQRG